MIFFHRMGHSTKYVTKLLATMFLSIIAINDAKRPSLGGRKANQWEECMSKLMKWISSTALFGALVVGATAGSFADELSDRVAKGEPVRLGFATAIPWAYPGDDGKPLGFVNAITLEALKEMGITNYETSVTEWAGLIPGLQAKRYDLVTGGMYILKSRCENMNFSDPIGLFGDAFLVPKGNPKNINNYQDVIKTGARMVTGAGFNTVEAAKKRRRP